MSSKSKKRGYAVEKWLEKMHNDNGILCERVPLSGSIGGKYSGDLCIPSVANAEFRAESKARKGGAGFQTLERWMGSNDILFLKRNHQAPLVVLNMELYLKLMGAYYGRAPV